MSRTNKILEKINRDDNFQFDARRKYYCFFSFFGIKHLFIIGEFRKMENFNFYRSTILLSLVIIFHVDLNEERVCLLIIIIINW